MVEFREPMVDTVLGARVVRELSPEDFGLRRKNWPGKG
jgi:hypothetical protein